MPLTDRMPTAGKLVAAAGLAVVAWYASEIFRPLMPDGTGFGWFNEVNVGLGLLCGWIVTGSRLGYGYYNAVSAGFTGTAAMVFWAVFLQSLNEMLRLALERRYDGPVEGLVAIFEIAVDYSSKMLDGVLIGVLVCGAVIVGLIAEWVARRWS